jgi:predicted SAM-dependent methyltransferase
MLKLHIGCGAAALPGWVNLDHQLHPGVDQVLDVRQGLPFSAASYIFAEHFLEHLTLAEALSFTSECRRALTPSGVLRISTPNLDWVWLTHYRHPRELDGDLSVSGCLELNRAFHGWGHQFLYNAETLTRLLHGAGFADIHFRAYHHSPHAELRQLEQHERANDQPEIPHVLIAEASGSHAPDRSFAERAAPYIRDAEVL